MRFAIYLYCTMRNRLIHWLITMGRDYVSEPQPQTGLLFIPRVICERGETQWWWCRLGITPDSSTKALWQSYQQRHLGQVGGMDEGVRILPISIWNTSRSLTCRKILRHGTSGFTSQPKEGVLRIFIALKNPSPRPGLNPRPLGPVASTLTTTPSKRLCETRRVLPAENCYCFTAKLIRKCQEPLVYHINTLEAYL
jgi:hypothetical protein